METLFGEVGPLLVLGLIAGLVEVCKQFGVEGKASIVVSLISGVVFGVMLQVKEMYPALSGWFDVAVYGLLFGLAASGIYSLAKRAGSALVKS